jgi:NADP-dependent 3-hydroxy acid dehydrogenase YdfG
LKESADQALAARKESGVAAGGVIATVPLDVSNRDAIKNLWSKVPANLRQVDVLGIFTSQLISGKLTSRLS